MLQNEHAESTEPALELRLGRARRRDARRCRQTCVRGPVRLGHGRRRPAHDRGARVRASGPVGARVACRQAAIRPSASTAARRDLAIDEAGVGGNRDRRPTAGRRRRARPRGRESRATRRLASTVAVGITEALQPLGGALRSIRLPEVEDDAEQDDRDDDAGVGVLAERGGHDGWRRAG